MANGEKGGPRFNVGMRLEQRAALPLGQSAPDAVLLLVVERLGRTFPFHRAVPADRRRLALLCPADEQQLGIGGPA